MSVIQFKNPPAPKKAPPRQPSDRTQGVLDALMARPGEWALITEDTYPATTTWWKKQPGIEAKSSTIGKPKGKCDTYARWVGVKK
jgi:hypothetical protein